MIMKRFAVHTLILMHYDPDGENSQGFTRIFSVTGFDENDAREYLAGELSYLYPDAEDFCFGQFNDISMTSDPGAYEFH